MRRNLQKRTQNKRFVVTMHDYYAFRLQQCANKGNSLLLGGRLSQQFVVDAYKCIEEECLK